MTRQFSIHIPFEGHIHFRQGETLKAVVPFTAKHFSRAVAMPNTSPPITTCDQAVAYAEEIEKAAASTDPNFRALVGLYLTEDLDPEEIKRAMTKTVTRDSQPRRLAEFVKFYPKGATTNSSHGVADILACDDVLLMMQKYKMPLCLHGEVNFNAQGTYDHLDRERIFVKEVLPLLQQRYPQLKIVLEHISTREAAKAVQHGLPTLAATVTPQHLMYTHTDLFEGGLRPHLYCMPILKERVDVSAIRNLVFSGHPRVFAGSDSAPHVINKKHSACCPAGVFSAPGLLERYATIWSEHNKLSKPEDIAHFGRFMSINGPTFYGFLPDPKMITLTKERWIMEGSEYLSCVPQDVAGSDQLRFYPLGHKDIGEIPFEWRVK